jgi:hypothetical protein
VSFDLAVLSGRRPLDADQAQDAYEQLASGADWAAVLDEDERVGEFVAALSARWPEIDTLREDQVDASPWSGGFEVSPAHVLLTMRFDAPGAVIEFCESTALGLGLNVFDPQDGTLYSPGREPRHATPRPQKTLICEACGKVIEPGTPHAESPKLMHLECMFQQLP